MKKFLVIALLITVSGCSFQAPRYTVMTGNANLIKGSSEKLSLKVIYPKFKDDGSIICRAAGAVSLPENNTFSQYIADALIKELDAANSYNKSSATILEFQLLRADFSSALGDTNWYIDSSYRIEDRNFNVSTIYHDRSSYVAIKACNNVAVYFYKAVMQHIGEVFRQPIVVDALKMKKENAKRDAGTAERLKKLESLYQKGLITGEEFEIQKLRILESI